MSLAMEITKDLAARFRLIGSEGEKWARDYLLEKFRSIGLEPEVEAFTTTTFGVSFLARVIMLPPCFLLLLSYYFIFKQGMPGVAALCSASIIVMGWFAGRIFEKGMGEFETPGEKIETANIIGRIKPKGEIKARAIMVAHYDAKSQTYSIVFRIALYIVSTFGILLFGGLFILCGILGIFGVGLLGSKFFFVGLTITFFASFLIIFNGLGNESPGAIDNAASVGIILEAAEKIKADPPQNVEVLVVSTGAEEVGLVGASKFVKKHEGEFDRASTYIINLDGVGSKGKIVALKSYGIPPSYTSEKMNNWIKEICNDNSIPVRFSYFPVGGSTDMYPFVQAGYQSINLASMSKAARYVHTSNDTMEFIDEIGLKRGIIISEGLVRKIDENISS